MIAIVAFLEKTHSEYKIAIVVFLPFEKKNRKISIVDFSDAIQKTKCPKKPQSLFI